MKLAANHCGAASFGTRFSSYNKVVITQSQAAVGDSLNVPCNVAARSRSGRVRFWSVAADIGRMGGREDTFPCRRLPDRCFVESARSQDHGTRESQNHRAR